MHRIWQAHALQPHRVTTFKFTTDPDAEAKIHDVVGLYLNPPTNAVVLSLDEKTQIQALSRTQPLLPLRPGLPARQTHDYRRNGLTSLYAALEVRQRQGRGRVPRPAHGAPTSWTFSKVSTALSAAVRAARHPGQFLDAHHARGASVADRSSAGALSFHPDGCLVAQPGRSVVQHPDPQVGAPRVLRHAPGAGPPHRALPRGWNTHPTPFVWTKDPAAIIKKALRRRVVNMTSVTRRWSPSRRLRRWATTTSWMSTAPRTGERSDPRANRRGVDASGFLCRLAQGDEGVGGGQQDTRQIAERARSVVISPLGPRAGRTQIVKFARARK